MRSNGVQLSGNNGNGILGSYQIYSGGSVRHARRQTHWGQHRRDQAFLGMQDNLNAFDKGTKDSLEKSAPINTELTGVVDK